jgi:hypothetical protein
MVLEVFLELASGHDMPVPDRELLRAYFCNYPGSAVKLIWAPNIWYRNSSSLVSFRLLKLVEIWAASSVAAEWLSQQTALPISCLCCGRRMYLTSVTHVEPSEVLHCRAACFMARCCWGGTRHTALTRVQTALTRVTNTFDWNLLWSLVNVNVCLKVLSVLCLKNRWFIAQIVVNCCTYLNFNDFVRQGKLMFLPVFVCR